MVKRTAILSCCREATGLILTVGKVTSSVGACLGEMDICLSAVVNVGVILQQLRNLFGEGSLVALRLLNRELLAIGFLVLQGKYRRFSRMIFAITSRDYIIHAISGFVENNSGSGSRGIKSGLRQLSILACHDSPGLHDPVGHNKA